MTRATRHLTPRRLAGTAAAALAVVTLAACGDDGPAATTTTTDAPTTVPETTAPETTVPETTVPETTVPATTPIELTFDLDEVTEQLVGMTIEDAETLAEENDWVIRQLRVDGQDRPATMDLQFNRINVAVEDGVITEVINGG